MGENNANFVTMEVETTPCCAKLNHKRRSTFFRRRSMLQAQADEDGSQNVCNKKQLNTRIVDNIENSDSDKLQKNMNEEVPFDLRKYIDDLKYEKKMWKQTLLDRKRQRKNILEQLSNIQQSEQDLDLNALSETERNFLLARPNYEHVCEKAKKLSVMAVETSILNEHVMHLHKRCILRAEKKLDYLTTRIIELVD